ncbi:MAG: hypothetical protein ABW321_22350, partial [Polyangiales bacterium]
MNMRNKLNSLVVLLLANGFQGALATRAQAEPASEIKRVKGDSASPILAAAVVPAGTTLYYLSGQVPAA